MMVAGLWSQRVLIGMSAICQLILRFILGFSLLGKNLNILLFAAEDSSVTDYRTKISTGQKLRQNQ